MPPEPPTPQPGPAAQLRQLMAQQFSKEELSAVCFDLGLDYDSLPGDGTAAKVVEIIEYFARQGRIKALIQLCATQRAQTDWGSLLQLAQDQPNAFRSDVVEAPADKASADKALADKDSLHLPANRALRLGFVAGIVAVLLLVCGFGGGLVAGQVVNVSINPVPVDKNSLKDVQFSIQRPGGQDDTFTPSSAGGTFDQVLSIIGNGQLPSRSKVGFWMNNIQATTYADQVLNSLPNPPAHDIHLQFLDNVATLNLRPDATGGRRVLIAYNVQVRNGKVLLQPQSAWLNVVEIPGTTFGWTPLPISSVEDTTHWLQGQLASAASNFWFEEVTAKPDLVTIKGRTL